MSATSTTQVPAGRYAVTGKTGEVRFYSVNAPTKGKWAGYVFISRLIAQGEMDYAEVKIPNPQHRQALLAWIARDPAQFSAAYGHAMGRCGVCSRVLSDSESLARGIGPICAGKMGW
jgi:hypothetical protein